MLYHEHGSRGPSRVLRRCGRSSFTVSLGCWRLPPEMTNGAVIPKRACEACLQYNNLLSSYINISNALSPFLTSPRLGFKQVCPQLFPRALWIYGAVQGLERLTWRQKASPCYERRPIIRCNGPIQYQLRELSSSHLRPSLMLADVGCRSFLRSSMYELRCRVTVAPG